MAYPGQVKAHDASRKHRFSAPARAMSGELGSSAVFLSGQFSSGEGRRGFPFRDRLEAMQVGSESGVAGPGRDEEIADSRESVGKSQERRPGSKSPHLPLSLSKRDMRVLSRRVTRSGYHPFPGRAIGRRLRWHRRGLPICPQRQIQATRRMSPSMNASQAATWSSARYSSGLCAWSMLPGPQTTVGIPASTK